MTSTPLDNTRLDLESGQVHLFYVGAGTFIQLRRGDAVLHEAPCWLAETMVTESRRLAVGQGHFVTRRGWLQVQAHAKSSLVLLNPTAAKSGLHASIGTLARAIAATAMRWMRRAWREHAGDPV